MLARGFVYSSENGAPLAGASVVLVNGDGVYQGQGVKTGNNGVFELDSAKLADNFFLITHIGHAPLLVSTSLLTGGVVVPLGLNLKSDELEPVVVTPNKLDNKLFWLWLLVAFAIGAVVFNKRKKLSNDAR